MDTIIHITLGFKIDGVFFGYHNGELYQLPYMNNGRYFGLRIIKKKIGKDGWDYYRIRRKKFGMNKIGALLENVDWQVKKPTKL
jgi:hypothetical protein